VLILKNKIFEQVGTVLATVYRQVFTLGFVPNGTGDCPLVIIRLKRR